MPNNAQLLLLDAGTVEQLLEPDEVFEAMKRAFSLHSRGEGRVFPVVREQLHTGGVFGIKSGDVPTADLLGFKAAGFWPALPFLAELFPTRGLVRLLSSGEPR